MGKRWPNIVLPFTISSHQIKSVLLVMPLSLIANWQREFENWAPGLNIYTYHGSSKREKLNALRRVQKVSNYTCRSTNRDNSSQLYYKFSLSYSSHLVLTYSHNCNMSNNKADTEILKIGISNIVHQSPS